MPYNCKNLYIKQFHSIITKTLAYGHFLGLITHNNKKINNSIFYNFNPNFSLDLPFDQALSYFKNLDIISPKQFYDNIKYYSGIAFTISKISSKNTIIAVHNAIQKNLENYIDLNDLKKDIQLIAKKRGEHPLSPFHIKTIIQTNLQTAFSKGNYIALKNNNKPYWQYIAIDDNRTTPLCASLDLKVFNANDPFWNSYFPPNHFNCRSTVVALNKSDIEKENLTFIPPDIPHTPHTPEPGFNLAPNKSLESWIKKNAKKLNINYIDNLNPPLYSLKEAVNYWFYNILNISNNKFEISVALDNNFNPILDKTANKSIILNKNDLNIINNAYAIIHNHPSGYIFSNNDMNIFFKYNIKYMILIINDYQFYQISNINLDYDSFLKLWNKFFIDNENLFYSLVNQMDYKEAYNEIKKIFFKKINKEGKIRFVQKTID